MTALDAVAAYLPPVRVPLEDLADRLDLNERQVKVFRRFHGPQAIAHRRYDVITRFQKWAETAVYDHKIVFRDQNG